MQKWFWLRFGNWQVYTLLVFFLLFCFTRSDVRIVSLDRSLLSGSQGSGYHFDNRVDRIVDEDPDLPDRYSSIDSIIDEYDIKYDSIPLVAIVIDDIGQRMVDLEKLLSIRSALTISILPYLKYSQEAMNETLLKDNKEPILHLPMQAKINNSKLGPGALFLDMDDDTIRYRVNEILLLMDKVRGINNHMGSLFTEDPKKMKLLFEILKEHSLFFLDSRTTSESVAFEIGEKVSLPVVSRDIFLDNEHDETKIEKNLYLLVKKAKKRGYAVGIGHPYPETINLLRRSIEKVEEEEKVKFVTLSELFDSLKINN